MILTLAHAAPSSITLAGGALRAARCASGDPGTRRLIPLNRHVPPPFDACAPGRGGRPFLACRRGAVQHADRGSVSRARAQRAAKRTLDAECRRASPGGALGNECARQRARLSPCAARVFGRSAARSAAPLTFPARSLSQRMRRVRHHHVGRRHRAGLSTTRLCDLRSRTTTAPMLGSRIKSVRVSGGGRGRIRL